MRKTVVVALLCGVVTCGAWAKGHGANPMKSRAAAVQAQQRASAVHAQQRAVARQHAAAQQQHVFREQAKQRAVAAETQRRVREAQMRSMYRPPHHTGFHHSPPPPNLRHWRRGGAPHPRYRSVWYGDVWYDAYGYPYYYNQTVVTPVQTVVPATTVVY